MTQHKVQVGIVDLDTSHPRVYAKFLQEMEGVEITSVWNAGDVYDEKAVASFAEEFRIPHIASDLDELAERCDVGLVLGVDWEAHLPRASVLLSKGVHVYIDKPVCGRVSEVKTLGALARQNNVWVAGGSPIRYDPTVNTWMVQDKGRVLFAACQGPFFYYGIHLAELAQCLLGPGIAKVTARNADSSTVAELFWPDGRMAILEIGGNQGFTIALTRESPTPPIGALPGGQLKPRTLQISGKERHRRTMEAVIASSRTGKPPTPWEYQQELIAAMVAGRMSLDQGGIPVAVADVDPKEGFAAASYVAQYAKSARERLAKEAG